MRSKKGLDYTTFGAPMPGRTFSSTSYRYGFNGMEKDDEVTGNSGATYTADYWEYDARLGRRWNVDPVVKHWESPYATFNNSPIGIADPHGDDGENATTEEQSKAPSADQGSTVDLVENKAEAVASDASFSEAFFGTSPLAPNDNDAPTNTNPNGYTSGTTSTYFNDGGYIPLDENVGYQMIDLYATVNVSVGYSPSYTNFVDGSTVEGGWTATINGTHYETHQDVGTVNTTAYVEMRVDGETVARHHLKPNPSGSVVMTSGYSEMGTTTFKLPDSGSVELYLYIGYGVNADGAGAIPVQHPVFNPTAVDFNKAMPLN